MKPLQNPISRRRFLAQTAAAGAALTAGSVFGIGRARAAGTGRMVILGFDGMEPTIVEEMMAAGELPHLAALRDAGIFARLGSTIPPQSPVAWSTFATCKNPGGHNIFDFIRRDPAGQSGPMPYVGTGKVEHVRLNADGSLAELPVAETYRRGTSFWSVADAAGKRCRVLNVPFAFPPDPLKNGTMLCALGVPDLRGTTSTFFSLAEGFSASDLSAPLSGGQRIALAFDGRDETRVAVPGPRDSRYGFSDAKGFTTADLSLAVNRKDHRGTASAAGNSVELVEGEWSPWLAWEFKMSPSYTVRSVTRLFPLELGERVRLYMSCQQYHPEAPYTPISAPSEFAADLADRYGLYKTVGWAYDTHALRSGDLGEDAFLADVRQTMAWRERLTLDELDRNDFDLLISAWTATDRVGHMFWRFRDEKHPLYDAAGAQRYGKALEETYRIADGIVGKVRAKLREDDVLVVMSDHGFTTWRTGFNVNRWLLEQGYLKLSNPDAAGRGFLMGIDWANTQAYSVGLSSMYLNLRGRESQGALEREKADATIAEVRDKLLTVIDPATGQKVFSNIYTRSEYSGPAMDEAPDISFGYAVGYQSSKAAAMGGVPEGLFEANLDKWSGEHAASDAAELPGLLACNRLIENTQPHIRDLGVAALRHLGCDVPSDFEGVGLL
jgi:predicted AlkP superfamily phosphohydrolase/phosphomutase